MRRHPSEMRELVWAMLEQGVPPSQILSRVRSGENDLGRRFELPASTFWEIRRQLIKQRGRPRTQVAPGEEERAIGAIVRRWLGQTQQALDALEAKRQAGKRVTATEINQAAKMVQAAAALRERKPPGRRPKTTETRDRSPSMLQSLIDAEQGTDTEGQGGEGYG